MTTPSTITEETPEVQADLLQLQAQIQRERDEAQRRERILTLSAEHPEHVDQATMQSALDDGTSEQAFGEKVARAVFSGATSRPWG